jgi:beta-N-acetylhexosaminidase
MTADEKAGQLFIHLSRGDDPAELERLHALRPAGITRFFGPDADFERGFLEAAQAQSRLPLLVSADLEGSRMSLAFGTSVPNPLALAAVDDEQATRAISRIMALEVRAVGMNWSFTPLLDINAAFRSPIVATRGFGSDPSTIERHSLAQIDTFQSLGLAATVKHWPGEGHDDRDQHLVTTVIPLGIEEWEATHGRLYRAAINAGVLSVMSAHIAFPAFVRSLDPNAGSEAFRPASVNKVLNNTLLRERLGFNGLIVSDATPMAGFGDWGPRAHMLPEVIANGCDLILFSPDPVADLEIIKAAIADGRISPQRLDEALVRILGLKAKLGLHKDRSAVPGEIGGEPDRATARAVTARAPTLVKDMNGTLPISPQRHRRVLVLSSGIVSPLHAEPAAFELPAMLGREGFEVTVHAPGMELDPAAFDLVLYLFGEETLLTRGRIFLDWAGLTGDFQSAMRRLWHDLPTVMISFGYPYYLYDAPRAPCYINAYATMTTMQEAVLECLLGRAEFRGTSPVDPFCGLEQARY